MRKVIVLLLCFISLGLNAQTPSGSKGLPSVVNVAPVDWVGWNTAGRPTGVTTRTGWNSDSAMFEYYNGGWKQFKDWQAIRVYIASQISSSVALTQYALGVGNASGVMVASTLLYNLNGVINSGSNTYTAGFATASQMHSIGSGNTVTDDKENGALWGVNNKMWGQSSGATANGMFALGTNNILGNSGGLGLSAGPYQALIALGLGNEVESGIGNTAIGSVVKIRMGSTGAIVGGRFVAGTNLIDSMNALASGAVFGAYNEEQRRGRVFTVGNGVSITHRNIIEVDKSGQAYLWPQNTANRRVASGGDDIRNGEFRVSSDSNYKFERYLVTGHKWEAYTLSSDVNAMIATAISASGGAMDGTVGNLTYYAANGKEYTTSWKWDSVNAAISRISGGITASLRTLGLNFDNGSGGLTSISLSGISIADGTNTNTATPLVNQLNRALVINTVADGFLALNTTPATVSGNSNGVAYVSGGFYWNGSVSQSFRMKHWTKPATGGAASGSYVYESSWNGNAYQPAGEIDSWPSGSPGGTAHFGAGVFNNVALGYTEISATAGIVTYYTNATGGTFTATLPDVTTLTHSVSAQPSTYHVVNSGTGTVTLGTTSSQNITKGTTSATTYVLAQNDWVDVRPNAALTAWYVVSSGNASGGYTLPTATASVKGGVIVDNSTVSMSGTTLIANIAWGAWAPTFFNTTNIASSTFVRGSYTRTGNRVTCVLTGVINATSPNTGTTLTFTLPVTTTVTSQSGIGAVSVAYNAGGLGYGAAYSAVTSSTQGQIYFFPTSVTNVNFTCTLQYDL